VGDYIVRAISLVIAMGGMNAGFAEKKDHGYPANG
jgi:hypothetical protein